mgnify:CR=1 FL=1
MSVSWTVDVAVSGGPSMLLMVNMEVLKQNGKWHATCPFPLYPGFHATAKTLDELLDLIPVEFERFIKERSE